MSHKEIQSIKKKVNIWQKRTLIIKPLKFATNVGRWRQFVMIAATLIIMNPLRRQSMMRVLISRGRPPYTICYADWSVGWLGASTAKLCHLHHWIFNERAWQARRCSYISTVCGTFLSQHPTQNCNKHNSCTPQFHGLSRAASFFLSRTRNSFSCK
jgi:hypothetical protein